ncbi:hypothetical protein [Methylomonas rosea]|uniref:Uncharacterized protein n=1 Tax=Methylomonas rosea TaxID=2952227 RepID=A0ABT1TVX0_9GAMM|nr:hypothetical protein [Methylomonas sp. WSC-7]MCQ8118917.1 hypothetical protein [Methylomonas sp. WSC-7]
MEITTGAAATGADSTVGSTFAAFGFGSAFFGAALATGISGAFSILSTVIGASATVLAALGLALVLPDDAEVSCFALAGTDLLAGFLAAFAGAGFSVVEAGVSDVGVVFFIWLSDGQG